MAEEEGIALREALEDPDAIEARTQLALSLAAAFDDVGELLWVLGSLLGPDRVAGSSSFGHGSDATVGLALIVQVGGELMAGASQLVNSDRQYAAMALVRQVVEVEYLAWAFAHEPDEAAAWLRSSKEERLAMWQPRHLRQRSEGRFRGADYQRHCELGGHPTPEARLALRGHTARLPHAVVGAEMVTHGLSVWDYVAEALVRLDHAEWYATTLPERESVQALHRAQAEWKDVDRFPMLVAARSGSTPF